MIRASGIPYEKRRTSTVKLLVLTSSDELLLILEKIFFFLQNNLMRRTNVLTLQYGFPEDCDSKGSADISFK